MKRFDSKVDYLSISFKTDSTGLINNYTPDDFIEYLKFIFESSGLKKVIFKERPKGLYAYKKSYNILRESDLIDDEPIQSGLIAYTPITNNSEKNNNGAFFSLSGMGCLNVDFKKIMKFLKPYELYLNITRIDLAVDYYDGLVTIEMIKELYMKGAFRNKGINPRCSEIEPKIVNEQGDIEKAGGYTFNVGKENNPKRARCYEKGLKQIEKKIETPYPDWTRLEIMLRNVKCKIPIDWYIENDALLVGAYPKLFEQLPSPSHIKNHSPLNKILKPIHHVNKEKKTLSHLIEHLKKSYGGLINTFKKLGYSNDKIIELLISEDKNKIPKNLINYQD